MRKKISPEWFKAKIVTAAQALDGIRNVTEVMNYPPKTTNHRPEFDKALLSLIEEDKIAWNNGAKKYFLTTNFNPLDKIALDLDLKENPAGKKIMEAGMQQLHDKGGLDFSLFQIEEVAELYADKEACLDNIARFREKIVMGTVIGMLEQGQSRETIKKELARLEVEAFEFWKKNRRNFNYKSPSKDD